MPGTVSAVPDPRANGNGHLPSATAEAVARSRDVDELCEQFTAVCESAVDPLEISSALEFDGLSDQAAQAAVRRSRRVRARRGAVPASAAPSGGAGAADGPVAEQPAPRRSARPALRTSHGLLPGRVRAAVRPARAPRADCRAARRVDAEPGPRLSRLPAARPGGPGPGGPAAAGGHGRQHRRGRARAGDDRPVRCTPA